MAVATSVVTEPQQRRTSVNDSRWADFPVLQPLLPRPRNSTELCNGHLRGSQVPVNALVITLGIAAIAQVPLIVVEC